jgi:hypothetical protein
LGWIEEVATSKDTKVFGTGKRCGLEPVDDVGCITGCQLRFDQCPLGDTTVAAAMLDRLLHRSVVINLDGESYRLRDHHAAADNLRRATTGTRQPIH